MHGIDEEATWARVAAYERENKALIAAEQTRRAEEAARAAEALDKERADLERARAMLQVYTADSHHGGFVSYNDCCVSIVLTQETDQRERLAKRDLILQTNQVMLGVSID